MSEADRRVSWMSGPLHVALVADFHPERLGASWQRALVANHIKVSPFDIRDKQRALGLVLRNRIGHRLSIHSYSIRWLASRTYNRSIVDHVLRTGANVAVFHNGDFVFPETIENLKSAGIHCVLYHADNPLPPHANRPETLAVARAMDTYLVWSEKLVIDLKNVGVRGARFMPFGWDEVVFPYEPPPREVWPGVLFVGGWDREREEFLSKVGERVPLKIYGPSYWGTRTRRGSVARQRWMGSDLRGAAAAKLIRESSVSLNVLRNQHVIQGRPDGLIMRHFEVPGAGGYLLSTRSGGATRLFPEGETGEYFSDIRECLEKTEEALAKPGERAALAARAHQSVRADHTYVVRMAELVRYLESKPMPDTARPVEISGS